jgi:hypothetical protein
MAATLGLAACAAERPAEERPAPARAPHGKPAAAVELSMSTRALGGGDHEVSLVARVTHDTPAFELRVEGERRVVGAARAGDVETLTARVHVDAGRGVDVVGSAATGAAPHRRTAAAQVRVGAPAPAVAPMRETTITLPDGTQVVEVRP